MILSGEQWANPNSEFVRHQTTHNRIRVPAQSHGATLDNLVDEIHRYTGSDDTILVMTNAALIHVLDERHSPGYYDVIMPGTFRDPQEELDLIALLEASPPKTIVWPRRYFDDMPSRNVQISAPVLSRWVIDHYKNVAIRQQYILLIPKDRPST